MGDLSIWFVGIVLFLPITAITGIVPWIVRRDIVFGITVPKANWADEYFRDMRSIYLKNVIIIGVLGFISNIIVQYMVDALLAVYISQGLLFFVLILYLLLYLDSWKKTKEYKSEMNWEQAGEDIAVVDTMDGNFNKSVSPWWFLLYAVIIIATLFIGYALYEDAPARLPMQYDLDGNVTNYADKSVNIIYQMLGTQGMIFILFFFIYFVVKRSKRTLDPQNLEKTTVQNAKMRYWWSIFAVFGGMFTMLLIGFMVVSIFTVMSGLVITIVSISFTVVFMAAAIIIAVKVGQSGSRLDADKPDNVAKSTMLNRKDDRHWKYGMFYFNPDDPAVFVEKRFGIGFTNNWAKWQSFAALLLILAVIVVSSIYAVS